MEDRRWKMEAKRNKQGECSTAALGCDPACAWNPPSLLPARERPKEKIIHHGDTENTEGTFFSFAGRYRQKKTAPPLRG
jgi:hypothetical protein